MGDLVPSPKNKNTKQTKTKLSPHPPPQMSLSAMGKRIGIFMAIKVLQTISVLCALCWHVALWFAQCFGSQLVWGSHGNPIPERNYLMTQEAYKVSGTCLAHSWRFISKNTGAEKWGTQGHRSCFGQTTSNPGLRIPSTNHPSTTYLIPTSWVLRAKRQPENMRLGKGFPLLPSSEAVNW